MNGLLHLLQVRGLSLDGAHVSYQMQHAAVTYFMIQPFLIRSSRKFNLLEQGDGKIHSKDYLNKF